MKTGENGSLCDGSKYEAELARLRISESEFAIDLVRQCSERIPIFDDELNTQCVVAVLIALHKIPGERSIVDEASLDCLQFNGLSNEMRQTLVDILVDRAISAGIAKKVFDRLQEKGCNQVSTPDKLLKHLQAA